MKNQNAAAVVIALIPARAGSKGVPHKNIRKLGGIPLMAHAIRCAKACSFIDHVVVSTDSERIARVARTYGAETPFLRPKNLAKDRTPMFPVITHAIRACEKYYHREIACIILMDPTAPLRSKQDIAGAYQLYSREKPHAIISGNKAHRNPWFNMVRLKNGHVSLCNLSARKIGCRQEAPVVYDINTVVWIYSRKAILGNYGRIPPKTLMYETPVLRSLDIDTKEDFHLAQILVRRQLRAMM